jgi:hypothetical protein
MLRSFLRSLLLLSLSGLWLSDGDGKEATLVTVVGLVAQSSLLKGCLENEGAYAGVCDEEDGEGRSCN